jgi:3-oxoacyl-[acyl-carrier-protein] synthase-3
MSISTIRGVRLVGVASAVPGLPQDVLALADRFGESEIRRISASTGVRSRHVAPDGVCASDLCRESARALLESLAWTAESVDLLVFVSQTPDYRLPATACVLQHALGLGTHCAAFDLNFGCSGYVYGLNLVTSILAARGQGRALLLVGDTINGTISPGDRSTALLFGDAGTATAIETAPDAPPMTFVLGSDGEGERHLIIPAGGARYRGGGAAAELRERENGNVRSDEDLFMNGAEVFAFTLREVPPLVSRVLESAGRTSEEVDHFVFHQANRFMLDYLLKRMNLPRERCPMSLESFGNTSCASIPITLTACLRETLDAAHRTLLLAGFGVGYSWAGVLVEAGPIVMPPLIRLGA